MSSAADIATGRSKGRPCHQRFYTEQVEDRAASLREGRAIVKDVDLVAVTAPYSKDNMIYPVATWLERVTAEAKRGKIPYDWADLYKRQYEAWKSGQEMPVDGTPIKGWGVISPAMQQNIVSVGVRTVEDLAALSEEGAKRIGMGAIELKNKAKAWLAQLNDKGPLTQKMASIQTENDILRGSVESLERQVRELTALMSRNAVVALAAEPEADIVLSDIMPDDAPPPASAKSRSARTGI